MRSMYATAGMWCGTLLLFFIKLPPKVGSTAGVKNTAELSRRQEPNVEEGCKMNVLSRNSAVPVVLKSEPTEGKCTETH